MSTQAMADAETAGGKAPLQTVGDALSRQVRDDVLKGFAKEILNADQPGAEAAAEVEPDPKAGEAEAAETESDLSQVESTPEPEATGEAEESEAPDGTEETEDHLDEELRSKLDDRTKERISRRIGKEVAKTKAERERNAELQSRVTELEAKLAEPRTAPNPTTVKPVPLAHVHEPGQLQAEADKAEQALEQCDDLLAIIEDDPQAVEGQLRQAGIKLTDGAGNEDYSTAKMRQALRAIRKNADRTLHREIPARKEYLAQASTVAEQVVTLLPELKDRTSERFAAFMDVLKQRPELKNYPSWPIDAAVAVLGREALQALTTKAKPAKAAGKPAKPVTIPKPTAAPPPSRPARPDTEELGRRALDGDKRARTEYIKSLLPKIPGM